MNETHRTADWIGEVVDKLDGVVVYRTLPEPTWESAYHEAQQVCDRKYGRHNSRYAIEVN